MLDQLARHALIDLTTRATGDLHVDDHHTVEDVGIALGRALAQALGDKRGIRRYGACLLAMDEALVRAALDLSGRPFLVWKVEFPTPKIGTFDTELVREFFTAFAMNAGVTLNVALPRRRQQPPHRRGLLQGRRPGAARRRRARPARRGAVPSTKGTLVGMTTVIVDYASGNLHSALKSFQRMADETGAGPVAVSADPEAVRARRPHRPPRRRRLRRLPRRPRARSPASSRRSRSASSRQGAPFLGICVGQQLMATRGLEHGETRRASAGSPARSSASRPRDPALKVPHMGWNALEISPPHPVLAGIATGDHAYFVHSYHLVPDDAGAPPRRPSTTAARSPPPSPATTSSAPSSTRRRARPPACG